MSDFDKELEGQLRKVAVWAWEQGKRQKDTPYDYTLADDAVLKQSYDAIKQAVDKYVIEEMRSDLRQMIYEVSAEGERAATTQGLVKVPVDGRINRIFESVRQSLWGDR